MHLSHSHLRRGTVPRRGQRRHPPRCHRCCRHGSSGGSGGPHRRRVNREGAVGGGLRRGRVNVNVGVSGGVVGVGVVGGGEDVSLQTHADAGRHARAPPRRPVPPAQRATAGGGGIGIGIGISIRIGISISGAAGRRAAEDVGERGRGGHRQEVVGVRLAQTPRRRSLPRSRRGRRLQRVSLRAQISTSKGAGGERGGEEGEYSVGRRQLQLRGRHLDATNMHVHCKRTVPRQCWSTSSWR